MGGDADLNNGTADTCSLYVALPCRGRWMAPGLLSRPRRNCLEEDCVCPVLYLHVHGLPCAEFGTIMHGGKWAFAVFG